ncbi:MAG TPA: hypothetical protein VNP20_24965, partial [Nocardioidaceae bacterium]|nr:hypothetical protein [Nocardioidaceae bacterium]
MAKEHETARVAAAGGGAAKRRTDDIGARRLSRLVTRAVLLVATAFGTLVALAPSAGADEADQRALAERYAPVMMLVKQDKDCGPGEPYQPSNVDPVLDNSTVALRGPWTPRDLIEVGPSQDELAQGLPGYSLDLPGNPLAAGCDYEEWARDTWGDNATSTIYAHVARQKGRPNRIALQYFFYYQFNDFNNKHESDWERIAIEFAAPSARAALSQEPALVAYGQHYGAETASWGDDKLEIVDGTHPVVYVSAGSHASQYSADLFLGRSASQGFGCDSTVGPHRRVRPSVETIPANMNRAVTMFPWVGYEGHWGEVGSQRFYQAPTGPSQKAAWTKPFGWSASARDRSFAVPGGDTYQDTATGFFCSFVEFGSNVFRQFTARPLPSLAVLAVVVLVASWLIRRTSWRSSPSLPAFGRRSLGQIIAVAWEMFWSRLGLFVCIGLPAVLVSLGAALLQTYASSSGDVWLQSASALGGILLALVLLWAQSSTVQALAELDAGRRVRMRDAYRLAVRRLLPVTGTVLLVIVALLLMTFTVVLIPVALVMLVGWSLIIPVVLLDRTSGFKALRRTWRL